ITVDQYLKDQASTSSSDTNLDTIVKPIKCNTENKQTSLKQLEVQKNREILERIIETIKTIGKRGLSFRGKRHEAAYSLTDETLDHGTFLEILILLGKFDPILKNHLDHVALKSKKAHQKNKTGRGSLVTFFSKTTINSIIQIICQIMRQNIVNEIKSAGMFSIQIDTTQDVKVEDQCSIIIRYLTDSVKERLIAVTNVKSSTGESMFQLVKETLEVNGVDLKYCIGSSTDGASNMQGRYKYLSDENPSQLHVWCYAHCLNLVMIDVTEITIESVKFFSLLNECANFLRESYKRMDVWKELCGNNKRLAKAGDTRWWSKESSITTIFGHFGMPESALYVVLISVMSKIANSDKFNRETRYKAITLKDSFLKYSFVMTSQLYLRIFERMSPLSKYLQTSGMDLVQAYRMVSSTITYLQEISRDFQRVKEATDSFIIWAEKNWKK
ncbi:protein FAM200A-like, partial [Acyrthosiphon pisum]|uniref:DUF4371 domain-containing protein n=1 Tax=Acyrthosiphon pisum TaxID=7029 RepID=A0A8R2NX19_ACYPI